MTESSASRLAAIAARFAARFDARLAEMRAALAADPPGLAALRMLAHDVTGVAGAIGFPATGEAARCLEQVCVARLAGAGSAAAAAEAVDALEAAFRREQQTSPSPSSQGAADP